jgi:hypothetical protein
LWPGVPRCPRTFTPSLISVSLSYSGIEITRGQLEHTRCAGVCRSCDLHLCRSTRSRSELRCSARRSSLQNRDKLWVFGDETPLSRCMDLAATVVVDKHRPNARLAGPALSALTADPSSHAYVSIEHTSRAKFRYHSIQIRRVEANRQLLFAGKGRCNRRHAHAQGEVTCSR